MLLQQELLLPLLASVPAPGATPSAFASPFACGVTATPFAIAAETSLPVASTLAANRSVYIHQRCQQVRRMFNA